MPTKPEHNSLRYEDAGVDIDAGNQLVNNIKPSIKRTHRPEVLSSLGGFGGLFELSKERYKNPVLISGTDGVGTKLKLAVELNKHNTIGIDLVAMCANDILVQGAEPLFFLDYYATSKLDLEVAEAVIDGIASGCQLAGAALIGGETAEMPGIYQPGDYDLAGFCVGVAEKDELIDGSTVEVGDTLIGLASSGPHSNGYSLIHKIIQQNNIDLNTPFDNNTLADTLLAPTRIYVKPLLQLFAHKRPKAIAHITGGGITENLPRVLPSNTQARINTSSWERPNIFNWIAAEGGVKDSEMYRTYNCGIGLVLCVAKTDAADTIKLLQEFGETAFVLGDIEKSETPQTSVVFEN